MTTLQAKVTSKGQVTLPKQLRTKLAIRSGDRLEFALDKSDQISVRKKRAPGSSAGCGRRFTSRKRKAVTVEDMDAGIRKAMSRKHKSIHS
ncbi:MAG: AbrB/MazE/SpoVT family DNA-binding domain-containing protein [Opitutaceae bacterium]|jgi:antitoxin PrlF|nr:AbrB/MazE/SpoVT family DNA-binding domain-containing protein [Opitutaceae bacterium]